MTDASTAESPGMKGAAALSPNAAPRAVAAALRDVEAGMAPSEAAAALGVDLPAFERLRERLVAGRASKRTGRLPLAFREADPDSSKAIHEDLSAIVATADGETLWVGADEGAALERLIARRDADGRIVGYGGHVRFDLHALFDLPEGRDVEADVEGLAVSEGYLWVAGSHSLARKKPDRFLGDPDAALERLTQVKREANRFLLGRIPLAAGDSPGVTSLARRAPALDGGKRDRRAGTLRMGPRDSALSKRLRKDVHLGPFLGIPSKDNGLDVEGVAVRGERVFLGLRGPVLRGWAVIVELAIHASRKGRLKLRPIGEDGCGYRKHFLDLDGLGVRSLMLRGDDIVVLAGPTMDLDGPVRLYAWRNALSEQESSVVPRAEVERILDLPFGEGCDHAEGATVIPLAPDAAPSLVVAYDTPSRERTLTGREGVEADVFELPPRL
jgi:hypothetical protein